MCNYKFLDTFNDVLLSDKNTPSSSSITKKQSNLINIVLKHTLTINQNIFNLDWHPKAKYFYKSSGRRELKEWSLDD